MFKSILGTVFALLFAVQLSFAKVSLPSVFSDNMVLQQKTKAAIWGKTQPGKKVTIATTWSGKKYSTVADADGNWKVKVSTPSYGGPFTIGISDGDITELKNVMIGEVWLCSGQSNMEMPVAGWGKIKDYEKEMAEANYPNIRLLQVEHVTSNLPLADAKVTHGGWTPCTPENVAEFSSAAYFFARELYKKTNIPIGLIHTSWGGTVAEAWTSGTALRIIPDFVDPVTTVETETKDDAQKNYLLKTQQWQNLIVEKDSGYSQGKPLWLAQDLDVSQWHDMVLPSFLEKTLPNFDGVLWLHKKVTVPAEWAGKPLKLSLGTVDDADITWFNGEKVGETNAYNALRNYTIPGNLVKAGDNVITIRVFDSGSNGGLYGDAKLLYLANEGGTQIPLNNAWQYHVGLNLKNMPPYPTDPRSPNRPSVLFNAMINPFTQFAIKGVIWYQGESNSGRAYQYRQLFPTMIQDWRTRWNEGNFPFYFVQLANYFITDPKPSASDWAELREAQLKTLSLPNTGMIVAIDLGGFDIHPKNKQEVGRRLALIALAKTYGSKIDYSGPVFKKYSISDNKVTLSFNYTSGALKTPDGQPLKGFSVAGADQKFYWADAVIAGDKVVVSCPQVANPVAVRYAWGINPVCNLYNGVDLPASPFRTDDWPGVTFNKK
ncbi:sialate O-acetylesterase [Mucilaginibacter sp. FT3.2]|uniref:sialate O-acetylesterase n=1 Tax=Mucilaginibacter sp. FT3.2 TaxID=2723090 RepID=UPI00161703C9|nr:sialate O-acetylesterase [Mucilaginibacter sp. FT3.2]MBB6230550.1 sialate O-acetylesterase [Mucilaginibacter sp. FT3.2]